VNHNLLVGLSTLAIVATGCGSEIPAENSAVETAAQLITEEFVREIIAEISSDEYEGRGPASDGDKKARAYLANKMAEIGLEPGAEDGSWEQPFGLVSVETHPPDSWKFSGHDQSTSFKQWEDFTINGDMQQPRVDVTDAEVVFAGYGIQAPEFDWDDYADVDVNGKIVLLMNNDPDWDPDLFAGDTRLWYGRWDYKFLTAAKNGAVGAIIIHTTPSAGYPFQVLQTSNTGPQMELPLGDEPRNQFTSFMTEDASKSLVALAGMDLDELREAARHRDFRPVPLGVTTSIGMDVTISAVQTANVLGLIPGSDPVLKDEVVVYTAHHDHLGTGPADDSGDTIFNGARDNASGVAEILAMARALASLPVAPRRSILICLVGAEEQGLLGSQFYADNPTFPPGRIAANVNIDGGNVWGRARDIQDIAFGKSSLDGVAQRVAERQGRITTPDQFPDKGYYYRSDQFNFAKIGVPALYFKAGTDSIEHGSEWGREAEDRWRAERYHQPGDEIYDEWDFGGMVEDARLAFWVGLHVANADEPPGWKPGDEFEAVRQRMLAERPE